MTRSNKKPEPYDDNTIYCQTRIRRNETPYGYQPSSEAEIEAKNKHSEEICRTCKYRLHYFLGGLCGSDLYYESIGVSKAMLRISQKELSRVTQKEYFKTAKSTAGSDRVCD